MHTAFFFSFWLRFESSAACCGRLKKSKKETFQATKCKGWGSSKSPAGYCSSCISYRHYSLRAQDIVFLIQPLFSRICDACHDVTSSLSSEFDVHSWLKVRPKPSLGPRGKPKAMRNSSFFWHFNFSKLFSALWNFPDFPLAASFWCDTSVWKLSIFDA